MSYVTIQPSLRDFGYWLRNPTLERVGYSQISLREIVVGYCRISPLGDRGGLFLNLPPRDSRGLFSNFSSGRCLQPVAANASAGKFIGTAAELVRRSLHEPDLGALASRRRVPNFATPTRRRDAGAPMFMVPMRVQCRRWRLCP